MQQCTFCVLLSYMSLPTIQKCWVLHNSAFMGNLCCWQEQMVLMTLCKVPNIFILIVAKFLFSQQIFIKVNHITFHKNLSSGSCTDTCREQTERRTWYANMPINVYTNDVTWHNLCIHNGQIPKLITLPYAQENHDVPTLCYKYSDHAWNCPSQSGQTI